jgi:LysM repeat protein
MVIITSFNEWREGTQIEPSVEHGNFYLQLTAELSNGFKSGSIAVPPPPPPPPTVDPNATATTAPTLAPSNTPGPSPTPTSTALPTETPLPTATATPVSSPTALPDGRILHIVEAGETLITISEKFEVPIRAIYAFNQLTAVSVLSVGQPIIIGYTQFPDGSRVIPELPLARIKPDGTIVHLVNADDTFISIAVEYGLTLEELYTISGLSEGSFLQLGQEVIVGKLPEPESVGGSADAPDSALNVGTQANNAPTVAPSLTPTVRPLVITAVPYTATPQPSPTLPPQPTFELIPQPPVEPTAANRPIGLFIGIIALLGIVGGIVTLLRRR